jgi:hypothetical protein
MTSKNYETKDIRTKDGALRFGHIHLDQVKSSILLQGQGGLEYITIDQTDPRPGWITNRCRGRYQIKCGDNVQKGQPAFWLDSASGDIVITTRGRIRMEAENIDIIAYGPDNNNGNINLVASQELNMEAKQIELNGKQSTSLYTNGSMQMTATNIMRMYAGEMQNVTSMSAIKPPIDFDIGNGQFWQRALLGFFNLIA